MPTGICVAFCHFPNTASKQAGARTSRSREQKPAAVPFAISMRKRGTPSLALLHRRELQLSNGYARTIIRVAIQIRVIVIILLNSHMKSHGTIIFIVILSKFFSCIN